MKKLCAGNEKGRELLEGQKDVFAKRAVCLSVSLCVSLFLFFKKPEKGFIQNWSEEQDKLICKAGKKKIEVSQGKPKRSEGLDTTGKRFCQD